MASWRLQWRGRYPKMHRRHLPALPRGYFLVVLRISAILCNKREKNVGSRSQTRVLQSSLKRSHAGAALARVLSGHRPTRFRTGLSSPFESQRGPSRSQRRRKHLHSPAWHSGGGWMNTDPKPTFRRGAAITSLLLNGSCGAPPSLSLTLCLKSTPQVS